MSVRSQHGEAGSLGPCAGLTPSEISDAVLADPGVSNFRIEEPAAGRFDISLVPSLDGPVPRPDDVRDRFAALHGGVHSVKCRMAAYLQPEPSGKYRLVYFNSTQDRQA